MSCSCEGGVRRAPAAAASGSGACGYGARCGSRRDASAHRLQLILRRPSSSLSAAARRGDWLGGRGSRGHRRGDSRAWGCQGHGVLARSQSCASTDQRERPLSGFFVRGRSGARARADAPSCISTRASRPAEGTPGRRNPSPFLLCRARIVRFRNPPARGNSQSGRGRQPDNNHMNSRGGEKALPTPNATQGRKFRPPVDPVAEPFNVLVAEPFNVLLKRGKAPPHP